MCKKGKNCSFLHRKPTGKDQERISEVRDVFGRKRHATHKDDMAGVGSWESNTHTLYIGNIMRREGVSKDIYRIFSTFGDIVNFRYIEKQSICFVEYKYRIQAEFAKEAMSNGHLDDGSVLNIRWAYPNRAVIPASASAERNNVIRVVLEHHGMPSDVTDMRAWYIRHQEELEAILPAFIGCGLSDDTVESIDGKRRTHSSPFSSFGKDGLPEEAEEKRPTETQVGQKKHCSESHDKDQCHTATDEKVPALIQGMSRSEFISDSLQFSYLPIVCGYESESDE
ncbi:putative multi-domain containing protein [Aduncisulcus paluster]|uniref:Multi-domain containing protein n=1 Tax=Aduncisulcus paluster TaxID=2918883 RepID=A0ABQ5KV10_9EUKA|nr:putative multi-domain containing protein [Aduncisulcus paluster]